MAAPALIARLSAKFPVFTAPTDPGGQLATLLLGYRDVGLRLQALDTQLAAAMEAMPVNAVWQADMASFFDLPDGRPDRGVHVLDLVFDLDAQLAAAGEPTQPPPAQTGDRP